MSWYIDTVDKLRNLSNPLALSYVTAKVIGGIAIGVLIATWIATWTWWIFMLIAFIIAIPVFRVIQPWKIFSK